MANETQLRDYLKRATADLDQVRKRLRAVEAADREPIAIVGMACRLPGGADSPEALWRLVDDGVDATSPFPADRGWDLSYFDGPGARFRRAGGFLPDLADFDPAPFGISPREAQAMDPQQRLVLEASWEAVERARIDPLSLRGSRTGVFAGAMYSEYIGRVLDIPEGVGAYVGTGSAGSVISGRVSYSLGLEGPSVTVDTACSSSLVALHLAVRALRSGECTLALAGGVSALVTPNTFVDFAATGGLAEDARCKSFAGSADGAIWAEGVGLLLLERLSDARRNGRRVLAVVRGTAVNSDGASSGLTVPNGPSQQRVIRAALRDARLSPSDVDAVEAHGTGTTLGDPIEAQALLATYGQDRDRPLWLGSVKSNIGHAQAAAGVGGVIKMVMALQHESLPRTLHVDEPTPHVDWSAGAVELLTEPRPWPRGAEPRRAGVSAFGVSGTNAHVVIEEAPASAVPADTPAVARNRPAALAWVVSGKTPEALTGQAANLLAHTEANPGTDPVDTARALISSRAVLDHRAVVVGADEAELRAGLAALVEGAAPPGVVRRTGDTGTGRAVFVFPGQGAQWAGMAAGLLDTEPVFRARIDECAAALAPFVDWSLVDVLRDDPLDRVDVVQPASWAVMVALAALWRSAGVVPEGVVGHSQGEIAAAVVAGALSLEDGARVVALRSAAIGAVLSGNGGMVSVAAAPAAVADLVEAADGGLSLAAENGPSATVVSGDPAALDALLAACADRGVRAKRIPVDYASHSAQVELLRERLLTDLAPITPRRSEIPFHSTVTGEQADTTTLDAGYWVTNLRGTVRFEQTVRGLAALGRSAFLEVSPHPVLTGAITETVESCGARAAVLGTLRRDDGGRRRWLTALAEAHVHGVDVDWDTVTRPWGGRSVDLPPYAFQRKRFWLDTAALAAPVADTGSSRFWDAVDRADLDTLTGLLDVTDDTPLRDLLPTMAAWRGADRDRSTVDSWRYRVDWVPVDVPAAPLTGTWLLAVPSGMADDERVTATRAVLTGAGAEVVTVDLDGTDDRAALAARLTTAFADTAADTGPAGVLSLLAFDGRTRPAHPNLTAGLADTLTLLHALRDAGITAPVWCATDRAVRAGATDTVDHPEQALVWGLGRVVAHENPAWAGLIDVAGAPDARLAGVLAGGENQVVLRADGVAAARLVRAATGDRPPVRHWRPAGTVLVSGGTGGIGAHVARWLARTGAGHLLLVSRRGLAAPGAAELADELRGLGTEVTVTAADLADRDALAGLLADLPAEHPLTAVFHAAGVADSSIVDALTIDRVDDGLRAKFTAARNLDELTRDLDLSAFVLFSSLAGVLGAAGEGNYGPGNAFLDALAAHRRDLGLPATSVAWGAWAGGGMADGALGDAMGRHGIPRMDPALGVAGLQQALDHDDTAVAVAHLEWDTFSYFFSATHRTRLLDAIVPKPAAVPAAGVSTEDTGRTPLAAQLASAAEADRNRALLALVREQVQQVLGYASVAEVEPGRAFSDLGLSSAGSVELRNRLTLLLGVRVPATVVFDHPTATALARLLADELTGGTRAETSAPVSASAVSSDDEPIAIVALSCRFPGGVASPEDLWRLVADGVDAIGPFPADRGWDLDGLYHPDPDNPGTSYARDGGFVAEATGFDPSLFGISPREALAMDPQQRLVLEASWELFERAGIDPMSLRGTRTGVYAGTGGQEYTALVAGSQEGAEGYLAVGGSPSVVSGRVAYTFGLEGPAVTVDTACSSSLVALHLAVRALRSGDCDLAVAGGVNVLSSPGIFVEFSRQRGMSADGRCKSFADAADGAGWGEGVGVLLVERLADARRNGHPVLAVVRGSAVNSDGASNGLTAPSGTAQQRVIRAALADAGLAPSEVDAVEAHGTGTTLGDPIEATALLAAYGQDRERPLLLGSVKSNIGHTQAASGAAGVIKAVLSVRNAQLPATLHVDSPSTHVDWTTGAVDLLTESRPWPETGRPRRVGVSSFGVSGTNAHVIIEQAPEEPEQPVVPLAEPFAVPLTLSAATPAALRAQAALLRDHLADHPGLAPADIAFSLAATRSALEHRAVVVGTGRDGLAAGLDALATGGHTAAVVEGVAGTADAVALVFPGQGAQWAGMATALLAESPAFADRMRECAAALRPFTDWDLFAVLDDPAAMARVDVVQPALWAVMVSLAQVWRAHGVPVAAVLGHSQGEIAAAAVAGALSLDDAARVVALRSRALIALAGRGGMVSVPLAVDRVRDLIGPFGDRLSVAAVNGPSSVVVSGEPEALDALLADCAAADVRARRIAVDYASHSAQVEELRDHLLAVLAPVRPRPAATPIYSTVTGELVDGSGMDAEYWYRGLRAPVEFERATRAALAAGVRAFAEASPHPVLTVGLQETIDDAGVTASSVGSLRRDDGGLDRLLSGLAHVHVLGVPVDWSPALPGARRVDLPTYAFQHQRFWPTPARHAPATGGDDARFWSAVEAGDLDRLAGELTVDPDATLRDLLPALSAWRDRETAHSTVDSWAYRTGWRPLADTGADAAPGWLVVAPAEHPWADAACTALSGRRVDLPASREDAEHALLSAIDGALDGANPPGVLAFPDADGVLTLLHALAAVAPGLRLWCATSGAVTTGRADRLHDPVQAAVWGLGRVAALEHPGRWGGLVDLPAEPDERAAARLVRALAGAEDHVAVRASGVFGRRLVRTTAGPAGRAPLTGTALITGGTGALGAHTARLLAERGADRLVLLSRSGPAAPGAADLAAELTAGGTTVDIVACDAADRAALATVLADIPDLTVVVHAACVLDDGVLDAMTPERMATVWRAKADAARNLHDLTEGTDLTAFVLFSSAVGTLGNAGQGNYAAANAYLDALAEHRAADGLPAASIAWGAWGGGGLAVDGAVREQRVRGGGFRAMRPELATAALDRALTGATPALVVADIDWARFRPAYTAVRSTTLFDELPDAAPAAAAREAGSPHDTLAALTGPERDRALLDLVRERAAAVLRHDSPAAVEPGKPFRDTGFDSLTAIEFRNLVAAATGLRLPSTLVFDHPTPAALAAFLGTQLGGAAAAPVTAAPVAAEDPDGDPDGDPVVVVGMGCRFPGGVASPEDLWRLLLAEQDAVSVLPADRGWDIEGGYDPDPDKEGTFYVREGGFVHGASEFDPGFFGISPREAVAMDPQQRLLLETTWEALERAHIDPTSLRGTATGVFAGINYTDYGSLSGRPDGVEGHMMTGNAGSVLSGRIAYALGLEGPAVTVDTACSASLVALHLAAAALRSGECGLAIAGGATIMCTPGMFINFSRQRGLSQDGRCKTFDAAADGTGWGEGAGVVVLERLSDARRGGHPVLAVLRGSAVNSDGASNGLTAPSGPAQQRVIRSALAAAGLAPSDVDAVEAHGTGTALGDPIEAQALIAAYGQDRDEPLRLGSLKSNIGHTQAAAGVAGVIKTVLALRDGILPRTLHVTNPTPHVDWSAGAVELLTETTPWPETGRPRRAGVSAFGIGGTNAHAIFEQAPDTVPARAATAPAVLPWLLSGHTEAALREQAARLRAHLDAHQELTAADVAYSLATTRSALEYRAVVTGRDEDDLRIGLAAVAGGTAKLTARARPDEPLAMLFTGQGAQRTGMGRELYATHPVFADAFDAVCARMDATLDVPLREVVFEQEHAELLGGTAYAQAALFAVEVAAYRLLEHFGVRPDVLVGHSVGEIAAAHVAGVLSLDDAAAMVAARGALMAELPGGGAMCAVEATEAEVAGLADVANAAVSIAAVNGPMSVVLSGDEDAVARAAEEFALRGRRVKRLTVSHAFHSALVEPVLDRFRAVVATLRLAPPELPVFSCVTGRRLTADQACSPDHWVAHLRDTVRFHDAVTSAGATRFLEVGPDGVLSALAQEALTDVVAAVPVLRRDKPEDETLLTALATLHVHGVRTDWRTVLDGARAVDLPTAAFQRTRYWLGATTAPAAPAFGAPDPLWQAFEREDVDTLADLLDLDRAHLDAVVPALSAWRSRHDEQTAVDALRYRVRWQAADAAVAPPLRGTWLAVTSGTGQRWTREALAGLAEDGATVLELRLPGDATRAGIAELIDTAMAGHPLIDGVVSLLALDERPHPAAASVTAGAAATLLLTQAMGDLDTDVPLWCLTRRGVSIGQADRLAGPNQAQVWGLGRVVGLEWPDRWGGLVDLPDDLDAPTLARLRGILAGAIDDEAFAIRPAGVFVRRLTHALTGSSAPWRPTGTVLVTGGTGALGAHVARYAAGAGAQRLVLTSRRGLAAPGAAELAGELTALGAEVVVAECDIADRAAVARVLDDIAADGPELTAVLHAAGVGQLTPLDQVGLDEFAAVADPKVAGARHLDELLGDTPLDAFVLFSSISGVWGSVGQPAYAAANAHLDALAEHRAARGLAATSIAWGPWAEGGMADGASAVLRRQGLRPMAVDRAVTALGQAVARRDTTVVVSDVDWTVFADVYTLASHRRMLDELLELAGRSRQAAPAGTAVLRGRLDAAAPAERPALLLAAVRAEAATVLGHPDTTAVEPDRAFRDLGFDSLTAVELRNRLQELAGVALPATVVFDHPSPGALAADLLRRVTGEDLLHDTGDPVEPLLAGLAKWEDALAAAAAPEDKARITLRLRRILANLTDADDGPPPALSNLDEATDTELFALVDQDLGVA